MASLVRISIGVFNFERHIKVQCIDETAPELIYRKLGSVMKEEPNEISRCKGTPSL